jgi:cytochrome c553
MKSLLVVALFAASIAMVGPGQAADIAAGKAKAADCVGCHGADGEGMPGAPALAGTSERTLIQAMKDYKSGKRSNAIMKTFASQLSDQDTANVAAYYASLKKK